MYVHMYIQLYYMPVQHIHTRTDVHMLNTYAAQTHVVTLLRSVCMHVRMCNMYTVHYVRM